MLYFRIITCLHSFSDILNDLSYRYCRCQCYGCAVIHLAHTHTQTIVWDKDVGCHEWNTKSTKSPLSPIYETINSVFEFVIDSVIDFVIDSAIGNITVSIQTKPDKTTILRSILYYVIGFEFDFVVDLVIDVGKRLHGVLFIPFRFVLSPY